MNLSNIKEKGIIFCPLAAEWNIQYNSICLIQGLKELEIPTYIEKVGSISSNKAVCCVDMSQYNPDKINNQVQYIPGLDDVMLVAISGSDSNSFINVNVPLFATHEIQDYVFEDKIRIPIGFGLSNEMIETAQSQIGLHEREMIFLSAHLTTANQSVRDAIDFTLIPNLKKYVKLDKEFSDKKNYYDRLGRYSASLTFGGTFYAKPNNEIALSGTHKADNVILRWDSWKIWEAFAHECLVINLNFNKYGFKLPEMPVDELHYIATDLDDPKASAEKIMDLKNRWREIAIAGRKWALKFYSPKSVAERFIKNIIQLSE